MVYQNNKPYFSEPKKFESFEALMLDVDKNRGNGDYKLVVNETHSDGMSTGLFADEEDGYNLEQNLEEVKYVLKGSAPSTDSSIPPSDEPMEPEGDIDLDVGAEDLGGDMGGDDKPFDDEPFDAGVEADEDTDPEKFIQQLSGKLGQSLRQLSDDQGQPNFDLEKFAVNSVLSATHTGEMDSEDQKDIINKVKGSGKDEEGGEESDEFSDEEPMDEPAGDDELDFGEEPVKEIVVEKVDYSNKNSNFVVRNKLIENLRTMEEAAEVPTKPMTKPTTKPSVKPNRPMREVDRPFLPRRKDKIKIDPKAEDDGINNSTI